MSLQSAIDALSTPEVLLGQRVISPGDEAALLASEADSIQSALFARRRASGAARIVARELLQRLGFAASPVPKAASGAPLWPPGVVGSMAHDEHVAVAALARAKDARALGIDVEPAEPLPPEMLDLVLTEEERERVDDDPLRGRTIFAAKEAVYKAAYPLDRTFLEFHDIVVDLAGARAVTKTGRAFDLRYRLAPRIIVLASA